MAHPETVSRAFEALLVEADSAARVGDWQQTYEALRRASQLDPRHPGALTGLGTSLLQLNRLAEALVYFQQAAEAAPDSPEAHNNLGVAYMLAGKVVEAEGALKRAVEVEPEHAPAWKNLALLYLRNERATEGVAVLAALVQSHPADVEALVMLAACYEQGDDRESARELYAEALQHQPDHAEARAGLARLQPAIPIRKPGLAQKLGALKSPAPHTVAFIAAADVLDSARVRVPADGLARAGWRVTVQASLDGCDPRDCDAVVLVQPQRDGTLVEAIARVRRVIVDVGDNAEAMPDSALTRCSALVVATPALAEHYCSTAPVAIIPDGWSRTNPLWRKPAPRRETFNVGWMGDAACRADLAVIKHDLLRFMRDFPSAQLVIGGDAEAWALFAELPEPRRLFLPPVPAEDYPFLLAHCDVLLAPLRAGATNSDRALMEAGARGIPWVASPRAPYLAWEVGGLFADKPGEWYAALARLAGDSILCDDLGGAGRAKAETREAARIAEQWIELLTK